MKKNHLSIQTIKKTDFQVAKEILKPDIIVKTGIQELDDLTKGFKSGQITYIDGNSNLISKIPDQICINTYKTFQSPTFYIDGGICANPYKIAQYAKKMELNQKEVLENIQISRAFTVYQLSTIIHEMLEPAIKRYKPKTLIIGKMPLLYLDSDVDEKESKSLLRACLHKIHELTVKYDLITIFTNLDKKMLSNNRNIKKILYKNADEIVFMKQTELATRVELVKRQENTVILHLAKGQLRLQEFGMVIN